MQDLETAHSVEGPRPLEDAALTSIKTDTSSQLLNREGPVFRLAIPIPSFISFTTSHSLGLTIHPLADSPHSSPLPAIHSSKLLTSNIINQRENFLFPSH